MQSMKKLLLALALAIVSVLNISQSSSKYVSHTFSGGLLTVETDWYYVGVRFYDDDIVKVNVYPNKEIWKDTSFVVIAEPKDVEVKLLNLPDRLEFSSDSLRLVIPKSGFGIKFYKGDRLIKEHLEDSYKVAGELNGCKFDLESDEAIYGLGMKGADVNRRGLYYSLYNANPYGWDWGELWTNINVPLIISSRENGIFFDVVSMAFFNAQTNPDKMQFHVNSGPFKYFLFAGDSYEDLLGDYYELTGSHVMLPRNTLGYIQSKFAYYTEEETRSTIDQFVERDYPIDMIVLDLFWFGFTHQMGRFDWDYEKFPNPSDMIRDFREKGVLTMLITEPYVAVDVENYDYVIENDLFAPDAEGNIKHYSVMDNQSVLLDIYKDETREWVGEQYKKIPLRDGQVYWWIDMNEPENHDWDLVHRYGPSTEIHNIYSVLWSKVMQDAMLDIYPEERPAFLSRGAYAGSHRTGAFFQSGDDNRTFGVLRSHVSCAISFGMSGLCRFSGNIGGATTTDKIPELYTRWMQFGAFAPILRSHTNTYKCEPFTWGEPYASICKKYIELRYRLLPYNYTLYYDLCERGVPLVRMRNFFDDDPEYRNVSDQYFWGDDFYVAPVVEEGSVEKKVFLPEGKWLDYFTREPYEGGKEIVVEAPLEKLPLFVRSGSIVPTAPKMRSTMFYNADSLVIEYYADLEIPGSTYRMYDDDGLTPEAHKKGEFEFLNFDFTCAENEIVLKVDKTGEGFEKAPETRSYVFKIFDPPFRPGSLEINGNYYYFARNREVFERLDTVAFFDEEENVFYAKVPGVADELEARISDVFLRLEKNEKIEFPKLSPNPASEAIKVRFNSPKAGIYRVKIVDLIGREIFSENKIFEAGDTEFDINFKDFEEFPSAGMYVLELASEDFAESIKFEIKL